MDNHTSKIKAIAIREIRLAQPSSVNKLKAIAAMSSLSRTQISVDELQKQADLLHIEAVLVTEGINDNDDAFTREELKQAISSPILKPMNWQHNDKQILGAMYAVEARDLDGNVLNVDEIEDQPIELIIQGVVWHQLPHIKTIANEIVQRIEKSSLFVSMECWFDNYDYELYTKAGDFYDHISRKPETAFLDRFLRVNGGTGMYNDMRIGRALKGISFGGIAFVDRPANKRSFILNHFAFDPMDSLEVDADRDNLKQDQIISKTTLLDDNNIKPTEVIMNDLNRAAASKEEIAESVAEVLEQRDRAQAQERNQVELTQAQASMKELESKLAEAKTSLAQLQSVIDGAYAGATSDTPEEITKIDRALEVKGDDAGDAVYAAKIAWLVDSRKAHAAAHASDAGDTKLVEENSMLKAELESIKTDLRKREIEYIFAEVLEMTADETKQFVEAGLSKKSDEEYNEWLNEKKILAKKIVELKKKDGKKDKKDAEDAEAGLLTPSQRETPIDELGAILSPEHGSVPGDIPRTPRSKLTASNDIGEMFEVVESPNLAGAEAQSRDGQSPMGALVDSLLASKKES